MADHEPLTAEEWELVRAGHYPNMTACHRLVATVDALTARLDAVKKLHSSSDIEWCMECGFAWPCQTIRAATADPTGVPVGDDTPAPTAPDRWTVGWVAMPSSMTRGLFKDGERVPLPKVARILNRAGATPSAQNDTEETT